jgi:hypothetical protein
MLVRVLIDGAPVPKPKLRGYALIKIPRARSNIRMNVKKLGKLLEIPGVISPPIPSNGVIQRGCPFGVIVESGSTVRRTEYRLEKALNEVTSLIEVDKNAIAWSGHRWGEY